MLKLTVFARLSLCQLTSFERDVLLNTVASLFTCISGNKVRSLVVKVPRIELEAIKATAFLSSLLHSTAFGLVLYTHV